MSTGHAHQWKRLPVTDFTVTYRCDCGSHVRVTWGWIAGSVCEVDQMLTSSRGGTVTGDVIEPEDPWEYCLAGRMSKISDLHLTVPAEDLRSGGDADE